MNIQDIYTQYRLMSSLQLHQRRVAGVAHIICHHLDRDIDTDNIVMACLLHDMGNIIKFKLDVFPEFLKPEGLDYWEGVKKDFIKKYGNDEHEATMKIVEEIFSQNKHPLFDIHRRPPSRGEQRSPLGGEPTDNMSGEGVLSGKRILELIDAILFRKAKENYESSDFGRKICAYADMRVKPHGVSSMKERLADGRARFKLNKPGQENRVFFEEMAGYLEKIEAQIFDHSSLKPVDITEEAVQKVISNF